MTRRTAFLLVLASFSQAEDPEGAVAEPARWSDPRGTPGGTYRSRALPVLDPIEEAWRVDLPGKATAPPVHWDGVAYLLCRDGSKRRLLAVSLHDGTVRAKKSLPDGPGSAPVVWDDLVVFRLTEGQLVGYELRAGSLQQRWKPRLRRADGRPGVLSDPVLLEREVYVRLDGDLVKLKPGTPSPLWHASGDFVGRPALYGSFVFVLGHESVPGYQPSLHLYAYERRTGRRAAATNVAWYAEKAPPAVRTRGELTISPDRIYVRGPAALAAKSGALPYASVPCTVTKNTVRLGGEVRLHTFAIAPSVHADGLLALDQDEDLRWHLWKKGLGALVTQSSHRAALFRHRLPATVLGDIVYFGTWAADLQTEEILWQLPVEEPHFAAVPADELVLVVDGLELRAFRQRTKGGP